MNENRYENLPFEYNNKHYEFGFGIEEVQQFSNFSAAKKGTFRDVDFLKVALSKYSQAGFITNKTVEEIQKILTQGITLPDDQFLEYEELIAYLFGLYAQAIDDEAAKLEPAIVEINKDNTVNVTVDGEKYKLMFNREQITEAFEGGVFDFNGILELYTAGSSIIRAALAHYDKRFSVKLHNHIFLSLWATKFDEETQDLLPEVLNALTFHVKEVVASAVKNSKAAIKMKA